MVRRSAPPAPACSPLRARIWKTTACLPTCWWTTPPPISWAATIAKSKKRSRRCERRSRQRAARHWRKGKGWWIASWRVSRAIVADRKTARLSDLPRSPNRKSDRDAASAEVGRERPDIGGKVRAGGSLPGGFRELSWQIGRPHVFPICHDRQIEKAIETLRAQK